jgi:hypothetical protein
MQQHITKHTTAAHYTRLPAGAAGILPGAAHSALAAQSIGQLRSKHPMSYRRQSANNTTAAQYTHLPAGAAGTCPGAAAQHLHGAKHTTAV